MFCDWLYTGTTLIRRLESMISVFGNDLAGYREHQIAPMFKDAPANGHLPDGWCSGTASKESK